jgi:hypothetical protein
VLEPCGEPLVDVAGLGFDEELAARRQQLCAAAQQPGGQSADPDVAVREQHGSPAALPGQRIEHRAVQGGCPCPTHPGHRGPRDVHAERRNPPFGQRHGQSPGAAAHVEDGTAAAAEQFLVGGVGRPAPAGHLERQRAAVSGPQGQRRRLPAQRLVVQRLFVQGDRPWHHAGIPAPMLPAWLRTVASSHARAAKRLSGA